MYLTGLQLAGCTLLCVLGLLWFLSFLPWLSEQCYCFNVEHFQDSIFAKFWVFLIFFSDLSQTYKIGNILTPEQEFSSDRKHYICNSIIYNKIEFQHIHTYFVYYDSFICLITILLCILPYLQKTFVSVWMIWNANWIQTDLGGWYV